MADLVDLLTSLSCPQSDPAQLAQFNDQLRHLYANLGAVERRILELRLQGYSTDEIAREVNLNPVALRVRLTRLRQRLLDSGVIAECL